MRAIVTFIARVLGFSCFALAFGALPAAHALAFVKPWKLAIPVALSLIMGVGFAISEHRLDKTRHKWK